LAGAASEAGLRRGSEAAREAFQKREMVLMKRKLAMPLVLADGGADGIGQTTNDNTLFGTQGIWIP
jgi:hypothetical protein